MLQDFDFDKHRKRQEADKCFAEVNAFLDFGGMALSGAIVFVGLTFGSPEIMREQLLLLRILSLGAFGIGGFLFSSSIANAVRKR